MTLKLVFALALPAAALGAQTFPAVAQLPPGTADTGGTITVSYNGVTKSWSITVLPALTLVSFSCDALTLDLGAKTTCTFSLSRTPTTDIVIPILLPPALVIVDASGAVLPPSVTMAAGAGASVTFTLLAVAATAPATQASAFPASLCVLDASGVCSYGGSWYAPGTPIIPMAWGAQVIPAAWVSTAPGPPYFYAALAEPANAIPLAYMIPIPQQLELVRDYDPIFYASMVSARGQ